MNLTEAVSKLPKTDKNVLVILSGGLDSSIVTMMLAHHYGANRVSALSYDYGQKQKAELYRAKLLCHVLGVRHKIIDLSILGEIAKPMSANIAGTDVAMPTIKDVLGDPQPKTYVPFRNMILMSLTLAQAEVEDASHIFCGLQVHDEYGYWDTSQTFVDALNKVASLNRKHKIEILAPFSQLSKYDEILISKEMGKEHLLELTLTCYNPDSDHLSCGKCPSCSERIANFAKAGMIDPIGYQIEIPWEKLISV